jgi:iron complex outermembrane receptor protein
MRRSALLFSSVSALVLATAAPAVAQTAAADQEASRIEDIVVTAQRREQNIQDVPLAVTAFTDTQLEIAIVEDTTDLVRVTPSLTGGLNTGTGGAVSYFIRGLGSTEQVASFDVPVATYVDEVYVARQIANNITLLDVDRIEVLRGPQGTLFGRNTTGGAISITTRKPDQDFRASVEGTYGSFDRYTLRGAMSGPVNEVVSAGVTVLKIGDDGYSRSLTTGHNLNGEDTWGIRAALRFQPSEAWDWNLSADYIDQAKTTIGVNPVDPQYTSRTGLRLGDCNDSAIESFLNQRLGNCARTRVGTLISNLTYDMGWASVSWISGYIATDQIFSIDFGLGGSPTPFGGFTISNDVETKQWTQELKLVGETGRVSWVAGLFYLDEDNSTYQVDTFATTPTATSALVLGDRLLDNGTQSFAVYAQGDISITDQLTLTLGGRYTEEDKDISFGDRTRATYPTGFIGATGGAASRPTTANLIAAGIPVSQSTSKFTPRVALAYEMNEDVMFFASATNGFKSGGWNARGTTAITNSAFGPEEAWSYELGMRSDLLEDTLRLNLTLYRLDVENLQLLSGQPRPGGGIDFVTRNAGGLEATGLEAEITWSPTDALEIYATGSIADREYVDIPAVNGAGGVPCSTTPEPLNCVTTRDQPVRFPESQATLGARYTLPTTLLDGEWSLNGSLSYSDEYWTSTYNDAGTATGVPFGGTTAITVPLSLTPTTTVYNIGVRYESNDGAWAASLDCSNCGEEYYITSSLVGLAYPNDPRRVTFRLRRNF